MPRMRPGSIVILHLINPTEKFWGVLEELVPAGVILYGLNLSSFDDWLAQAVRGERQTLGLATMFVPLFRVERMFVDDDVGEVASYRQRFERRVGRTVEEYLGLGGEHADGREVPS
jgi:hypothetical protein